MDDHRRVHGERSQPTGGGHGDRRRAPRRVRDEGPEAHRRAPTRPGVPPRVLRADVGRPGEGARLCCCDCGRVAGSRLHGTAELCRLIGWSYDSGVALCLRCQWRRGETPLLSRRIIVTERPSWLRTVARRAWAWLVGDSASHSPGR